MLREARKAELTVAGPSHVDLFVANYDKLRRWAVKFTENDQERAEDLLHDLFIHFTLARPDLSTINNLDSYLYVVMRNLHLSQVRRATRAPLRSLSAVEYDTADVSLWWSDPRDRIRMRDELAAVCRYACFRKETSKAGSVLILRFFHGYYPDEIASVLHSTRAAVDNRLFLARNEARTYLDDPSKLGFIGDKPEHLGETAKFEQSDDLRFELRRQIFATRKGECFSISMLEEIYLTDNMTAPDQRTLSHLVSCEACLDRVNDLLELPRLAERYPLDTLGKDPGDKDGGGGSGGSGIGGGGGTGDAKMLNTYMRRREAIYHHRPDELCVAVNGHLQSSQKVSAARNELTLVIDMFENLGFVEVFSEQGMRLLFLNVEPPPEGEAKQSTRIELSDGRIVDANLTFGGSFPTLQVTYSDPTLESVVAEIESSVVPNTGLATESTEIFKPTGPRTFGDRLRSLFQPVRLTVGFAALLIATLLVLKFGPWGTPAASDLIARSIEADNARLADGSRVLHRTLDLEETSADGSVLSRKKIDIWQSGEKGITARRLYDEKGQLTAGDWRQANGVQTIYSCGNQPKLQPLPEKRAAIPTFDDAWQVSASAQDFKGLIASLDKAQVEALPNAYRIAYESVPLAVAGGSVSRTSTEDDDTRASIIRAAITLSREDLHATEEDFTIKANGETRTYRIIETGYDWKPSNTVAPAVFEPNIELTGIKGSGVTTTPSGETPSTPPLIGGESDNSNTSSPPASIATASLEAEVVDALNTAGAFMGEQVNVSRTSDGKVSVTALVETADRKRALLSALNNFKANPAVRIQIDTVAEVQAQQQQRSKPGKQNSTQSVSIDNVEVTQGDSPVFADLKRHFSDEEARRFADSVLARSHAARQHALAAKLLAERFSESDLASLSPAEHARWVASIRAHAEAFVNETTALQRDLREVFPEAAAGTGASGGQINSDRELQARTRDLYEAALNIDRGLGGSFAIGAGHPSAEVKTSGFWHSFGAAVGVARSLAAAR